MTCCKLPARDRELVQIVDAAFGDAAKKSGAWLLCKSGCNECCTGVFPISQLDATRLRLGMAELENRSHEIAKAVRERARLSLERISGDFPGDRATGIIYEDEESQKKFDDFANEERCPALDPATGRCEVYEWRPIMCRVFGPPVRWDDGLGACELCFQGASADEMAACELKPPDDFEKELVKECEESANRRGETIVAYCLID
jgi:Fe-S-cluster containining protein